MAKAKEDNDKKDKKDETVKGYSGSQHEGAKPAARPKDASDEAAVSPLGAAEPSIEIREKQT
jgi:hypothetical protein